MNWKLTQLGMNETVAFACEELSRYLKKMDHRADVAILTAKQYNEANHALYIGCDPCFDKILPAVADKARDDAICIRVSNGAGIITGTNPRSVLIAVYRYLRELGCAFLRPGKDGEYIPRCSPEDTLVTVCEAASYRHRAICIEGAVSYGHIADMLDWIPKVAMNGYFVQFRKPYEFLNRWYHHVNNPSYPDEPMTDEEFDGIYDKVRGEMKKRGLLYHAVGHSWTCEPFGVEGSGWTVEKTPAPDSIAPHLALVNGKRDWWGGIPLNTNLCYSMPAVRSLIARSIVDYCIDNPDVRYLHFWLADASNNHCECENCRKIPADYYVMMLNEVDRLLTERNIDTKIVFLIYVDLLWAPKTEKINNPDRFVLMFAPITRTYSRSFTASGEDVDSVTLPPYEKNHNVMPRSVAENIAHLREWQKQVQCDSFDFDYHMMWDHYHDPGYIACAKTIHEDMKNLSAVGLNGMNSCQTQRAFFPTSLPMLTMAETLWNKDVSFADLARSYFRMAFGTDGIKVWRYLSVLSDRFDPVYLRGEKETVDEDMARQFARIPAYIDSFLPVISKNIAKPYQNETVKKSWEYLLYHAQACKLFAQALAFRADGMQTDAASHYDQLLDYLREVEPEIHPVFDLCVFTNKMTRLFR